MYDVSGVHVLDSEQQLSHVEGSLALGERVITHHVLQQLAARHAATHTSHMTRR